MTDPSIKYVMDIYSKDIFIAMKSGQNDRLKEINDKGKLLQEIIHTQIVNAIHRENDVIDIGCGRGNLTIKLAKALPGTNCIGLDSWGKNWETDQLKCFENAKKEGVSNINFIHGSKQLLPLPDSSVHNVVSCLCFHDIKENADKADAIKEFLRILKKGGTFTFLELFKDNKFYNSLDTVKGIIEQANATILKIDELFKLAIIPSPLNTGKVSTESVLIAGRKN